jgi:hypothetical protein
VFLHSEKMMGKVDNLPNFRISDYKKVVNLSPWWILGAVNAPLSYLRRFGRSQTFIVWLSPKREGRSIRSKLKSRIKNAIPVFNGNKTLETDSSRPGRGETCLRAASARRTQ